jgi:hypothetical protein
MQWEGQAAALDMHRSRRWMTRLCRAAPKETQQQLLLHMLLQACMTVACKQQLLLLLL